MEGQSFKEDFLETLWLIKTCLTTFWFWVPVLYLLYFYIQVWMIFFIHPLTIVILPAALGIYAIVLEDKRIKSQYGLAKDKRLKTLHPIGGEPEPYQFRWEIEEALRKYEQHVKQDKETREEKI